MLPYQSRHHQTSAGSSPALHSFGAAAMRHYTPVRATGTRCSALKSFSTGGTRRRMPPLRYHPFMIVLV